MLSVQLDTPQHQLLTAGSSVSGMVHISELKQDTTAIEVSIRCKVQSIFARNRGQYQDVRSQTTLVARSAIELWDAGAQAVPENLSFRLSVPETQMDGSALLPSFDAGRRSHADALWNMTYRAKIGHVRWSVQVRARRGGKLKRDERASVAIVVMPRSDAPPLLPSPVTIERLCETADMHEMMAQADWTRYIGHEKLTRGLFFGSLRHCVASLYLPSAPVLCRGLNTPFCIVIDLSAPKPSGVELDWSKATLRVRRLIKVKAHGSEKQSCEVTFDEDFLHDKAESMTGKWVPADESSGADKVFRAGERGAWVQQSAVAGSFVFNRPPDFAHPQLTVRYFLRLEVPFAGIANRLKLEKELHIMSGCQADAPPLTDEGLDLPPAYFDDEASDDESDGKSDKKR